MSNKLTTSEFIQKAKKIHGEKYNYDFVEYENSKKNVCIICSKHGKFFQSPYKHLTGQGCPLCSKTKRGTNETFIEKAKKIHGDKYDYSKVNYVNSNEKVCIICKEHGEFWQDPHNHLKGKGCPICSKKITKRKKYTTESFIKEANKIHKNEYDYSKSNYIDMNTKIIITCSKHGDFKQTPYMHLNGSQCPVCSKENSGIKKRLTKEQFVENASKLHNNKYDYSNVEYVTAKRYVNIICPIHGEFKQTPDKHLSGCGCPKCVHHVSKNESEIFDFVSSLIGKENVIQSERKIIFPKEINIYIPKLKIGIEYNGIFWHSEKKISKNRHLEKLNLCNKNGIKLIQIFEDEYIDNKNLVYEKLKHLLNVSGSLTKIMGRKCEIKEIDNNLAKNFLNKYHIQGYGSSTIHLGAFYNNLLIAVMSFKKESINSRKWELTRFASDYDYICQGVGGKLFKYFIRKNNPDYIKSFADRRWTIDEESNVYTKLGFVFDSYTPPDYKYFNPSDGIKRQHKFGFRKKQLNHKYGLPLSMTESEMTKKLGYEKIYDCGLIKYIWKKAD